MGCFKITLLIVFGVVQIAAIALALAAIVLPEWLDPSKQVVTRVPGQDRPAFVDNVGLWQLCITDANSIDTNITRNTIDSADSARENLDNTQETFSQIGSDNCKTGDIVEDFYKAKPNAAVSIFGENVYAEFIATRACALLFGIFAICKLFTLFWAKCPEEGGWCSLFIAVFFAIFEAGAAAGTLIAYGLILNKAVDKDERDVDIQDYWGISYQLFLSGSVIAVVADLAFCICCS